MALENILYHRMKQQHLLSPSQNIQVVQDLCGLQAQYLCHALHGLLIRTGNTDTSAMVKNWTIRGTMHIFAQDDLPLFMHEGQSHFLRPVDTMESDAFITAANKRYFADLIIDAVSNGTEDRETLKQLCFANGMTEGEGKSIFDPWGGLIRALCEAGKLCHKVQEKKAYALCPSFEPMEKEAAQLELARRYFTHYGPATAKDAAYFFSTTQTEVKKWLHKIPVTATECEKDTYYHIGELTRETDIPHCLLLAGFDPFVLGYKKANSLVLAKEHLREIFTLSGIVRPAIFTDGKITGRWSYKNRKLVITDFDGCDLNAIEEIAARLLRDLKQVIIQ